MFVNKNDVLRVLMENKSKKFSIRFYSAEAEHGGDPQALVTYETIIPKGSMLATYTHLPEMKISAEKILQSEWNSIAYVKMEDEVICKRSHYGAQMRRISAEAFKQSLYKQTVENDLLAQARGREIIISDETEELAGSLMQGFRQYRKAYLSEKENS
ncbi:hypothetical protein [Lactococcus ileimucosae]|uniref:hypothetical protein n=1 Tax=Lactococcus ileimucosae TaxID=2941329 RepID=UPI00204413D0|nr:hypothetical protein [Lactococcus ileimucosae]